MDSRHQVTHYIESARNRFLDYPINPEEQERDDFDLQKEFTKASRNRNIVIPLFSTLFLLLLLAMAYITSLVADQINHESQQAIGQFEDLKLKELFDTAKKNQRDLENIHNQISMLRAQFADSKNQLQEESKAQIAIIVASDISAEEKEIKKNEIIAQFRQALRRATIKTDTQIAPLLAEANAIQKKIDNYDNRIGTINKKNQERLDSQQRVFQMEHQKTVEQYENRLKNMTSNYNHNLKELKNWQAQEVSMLTTKHTNQTKSLILKYNPIVDNPDMLDLFHAYHDKNQNFIPGSINETLSSILPPQSHQDLQTKITSLQKLITQLQTIEYVNSVPPWLHTIDQATVDILSGYEGYLAILGEEIRQKNEDLLSAQQSSSGLLGWIEPIINAMKESDGLVVSAHDSQDLMIILKKEIKLIGGEIAILRNPQNNEEVAVVELAQNAFYVQGSVFLQKDTSRRPKKADLVTIDPK